jgi:hypothetical protein
MGADSNTSVDIEAWIQKIIKSIDHPTQFKTASRLISRYMVRLEQDGLDWYIRNHIDTKFDVLITRQRQIARDNLNAKLND